MGMGLSTVYGIVRQSGGYIDVQSAPGHGATFALYFPRKDRSGGAAGQVAEAPPPKVASETILLVEDEPMVRELIRDMLRLSGYNVLEAGDGEAALRICAERTGTIDLLLTDVMMPGMNGGELAKRVAGLRPDTRVLFMSCYTDDLLGKQRILDICFQGGKALVVAIQPLIHA